MKNIFNTSNPTIGVAIPVFWSGQFIQSLKGILSGSSKHNINLICFQGAYFSNSYNSSGIAELEKSGDIVFDLLKDIKLDGIIIHSGSLRSYQHKIRLIETCKKYFSVPTINIGARIDGINNVLVDNECGMTELLNHLIHDHGYRKFGFIRGPEDNQDAQARYATFKYILEENNIPFNQSFITPPGVWSHDWGRSGARDILNKSRKNVDVIICASDLLASGAVHELDVQKIKVPNEIAVVGFNDNNFAESCIPALTTVNLKLYERSYKAVEILAASFNGAPIPENIKISSSLVIRRSCGCDSVGIQAIDQIATSSTGLFPGTNMSSIITPEQLKTDICKELHLLQFPQPDLYVNALLDAFITQLKDFSSTTFIHTFGHILNHSFSTRDDYQLWHLALSILEEKLLSLLSGDNLLRAKDCILQARVLIGEVAAGELRKSKLDTIDHTTNVNSLNYCLIKIGDIQNILNLMKTELPKIGLPSCYLSLYTDPQHPLDNSRLIMCYNKDMVTDLPPDGILFKSTNLIPDDIPIPNKNSILILEPLYNSNNQIGFTLFEIGSLEKSFYALFPSQLSAALWSSILFTKNLQAESANQEMTQLLETKNRELVKWTSELESALKQLQSHHEQLLTSEKMASLGKFTAGITHEMNTPLATLRASLSEMKKLALEYKNSIHDPSVTPEDHHEIVSEFSASLILANKATARATDFIKSIKAQSHDSKSKEIQTFHLPDIINSVSMFLHHQLKRNNCIVEIIANKTIRPINASPTKTIQVFTNLFSNAIDAMADSGGGVIKVEISNDTSYTTLIKVSDTGCGISKENLPRIFEPMFTTKPFGKGTGLGLGIVYDIVTTHFNGTIDVESVEGTGTTFLIKIQNDFKEQ